SPDLGSALVNFGLGEITQLTLGALLNSGGQTSWLQGLLSKEVTSMTTSALNPDSGWLVNPRNSDWSNIAISALNPFEQYLVDPGTSWTQIDPEQLDVGPGTPGSMLGSEAVPASAAGAGASDVSADSSDADWGGWDWDSSSGISPTPCIR